MNRGWASSLYGCRAERSRCGSANNSCALTGLQSTENRIKWRRKPQDKEDELRVTGSGITCIINVTEKKSSSTPPPGVEYIHIPVSDTPRSRLNDHFDEVADKVQITAERSGRTLLHCNAGVSRSAALCMAYLMKHRGVSLLEAHGWVRTCRPVARPNNGFWKQLVQYEKELRGCNSVHMVSSSMGEIPDIYEEEARNMMPL